MQEAGSCRRLLFAVRETWFRVGLATGQSIRSVQASGESAVVSRTLVQHGQGGTPVVRCLRSRIVTAGLACALLVLAGCRADKQATQQDTTLPAPYPKATDGPPLLPPAASSNRELPSRAVTLFGPKGNPFRRAVRSSLTDLADGREPALVPTPDAALGGILRSNDG